MAGSNPRRAQFGRRGAGIPGRRFAQVLQNQGGEFERAFGKETPFACALRTGTPPAMWPEGHANDGGMDRRGLPASRKVSQGRVKALGFNTSLSGEERHPTGVIMGFGTVH